MDKKEATQVIDDFIKFNAPDIGYVYKTYPEIGVAFENLFNALSKEYGSGEDLSVKLSETKIEEPVIEKTSVLKDTVLKVGDKVYIPKTKQGINVYGSAYKRAIEENKDYLYVTGFESNSVILDNILGGKDSGDFYNEKELTPYPGNIKIGDKIDFADIEFEVLDVVNKGYDLQIKILETGVISVSDLFILVQNIENGNAKILTRDIEINVGDTVKFSFSKEYYTVNSIADDKKSGVFKNNQTQGVSPFNMQNLLRQIENKDAVLIKKGTTETKDWREIREDFVKIQSDDRKVKDLPAELQNLVFANQIEQGNTKDSDIRIVKNREAGNFDWAKSFQGDDFWGDILVGNWVPYFSNPSKYERQPAVSTKDWRQQRDKFMKTIQIKDLSPELKELALENQKLDGNPYNENANLNNGADAFIWRNTKQGTNFWNKILQGNWEEYYNNPSVYETQTTQPVGSKLNVETIPATLRFGVKFSKNTGDRKAPTQSAGDLYRGYNTAKDVSEELLQTYFKGNDGLWYQLVERGGTWVWKKASPQPKGATDYTKMSDKELRILLKDTADAMTVFDSNDPEYKELSNTFETIKEQLNQNQIKKSKK